MLKFIALGFLALSLAACGTLQNGDLSFAGHDTGITSAQLMADELSALAVACPVVAAVQTVNPQMSAVQRTSLAQLAVICPPNAPPTDVAMAAADILGAYEAIAPLVHK